MARFTVDPFLSTGRCLGPIPGRGIMKKLKQILSALLWGLIALVCPQAAKEEFCDHEQQDKLAWERMEKMSKGMHIILDCYHIPAETCLDDKFLLDSIVEVANSHKANIISTSRYHFGHNSPAGCAIFVMLDESHVSIHTYAELGLIAIDVFTCGKTDARAIAVYLKTVIGVSPLNCTEKILERF